jgi:hypothetical protein
MCDLNCPLTVLSDFGVHGHLPRALHARAERASYPRSGKGRKDNRAVLRRIHVDKRGTFEPAHLAVLMNPTHPARAALAVEGLLWWRRRS